MPTLPASEQLRSKILPLVRRMRASVEEIRESEYRREFSGLANLIEKWANEFDEALNADTDNADTFLKRWEELEPSTIKLKSNHATHTD